MILHNINFIGLKLNILDPKQIIKWSTMTYKDKIIIGEVLTPDTIDVVTGQPIMNGLFCEKIFDHMYVQNCGCDREYVVNYICSVCGTPLIPNLNRRYKLGFVSLIIPMMHSWYVEGPLQVASLLLNKTVDYLDYLIHYRYFFHEVKNKKSELYDLSELKFEKIKQFGRAHEDIREELENLNVLTELVQTKELLLSSSYENYRDILYKRINLLNLFLINDIEPFWILLSAFPILPAGLRPYYNLKDNLYIVSTINELYRLIIIKNNVLKYLSNTQKERLSIGLIVEKRSLQFLIDQLLTDKETELEDQDQVSYSFNKIFQGKYSTIRYNLLGKRVDYSGRSVITVSPHMPYNNIGLPYYISLNLFKPFLLKILQKNSDLQIVFKSLLVNENHLIIQKFLNKLLQNQFVLVNRAPTLHRMNLQSFIPKLIEGYSIKFYPLGCASFNADFDGDQMSIFIPLLKTSKLESSINLHFDKNIISPSNSRNLQVNTQHFKLGINTLLTLNYNKFNSIYYFNSIEKVYEYYNNNVLSLINLVWIKCIHNNNIFYILTSVGRIIINLYMYIY